MDREYSNSHLSASCLFKLTEIILFSKWYKSHQ